MATSSMSVKLPDEGRSHRSCGTVAPGVNSLVQLSEGLLAWNKLYPATLDVVVAPVKHFARFRQLVEHAGHGVLYQPTSRPAALRREFIQLFFNFRGELHFHGRFLFPLLSG